MSNTTFSKNLRKLREERQISQKSTAASLGISQALLSHYEKGIRECGLDFLIRAAKFYNVSSDFLLGMSDGKPNNTNENNISRDTLPDLHKNKPKNKSNDDELKKNEKSFNIYAALYKNLLTNAITYIFDSMKDIEYKDISILSGKHISLSIHSLYHLLHGGLNKNNPFENYNSENTYLNIIINGVDIKI